MSSVVASEHTDPDHPPPPGRPASLMPVLEDNLARTPLPTVSCLIGSPYTQTQGETAACACFDLREDSGFHLSLILSFETSEGKAGPNCVGGWFLSVLFVVDVSACLDFCRLAEVTLTGVISGFHRKLDAYLFLGPRETVVKTSKKEKNLNLRLCYFNLFYLTSFSALTLYHVCQVHRRFDWMRGQF